MSQGEVGQFAPPDPAVLDDCVREFGAQLHSIRLFGSSVRDFFAVHPTLSVGDPPAIHSVRYRIKSEEHLRAKIVRKKVRDDRVINAQNLLDEVTDLVGVRVLHLHLQQFGRIDESIRAYVGGGHLSWFEEPKAYTWDPETKAYLENLGLDVLYRENYYTSIHYVVKPNPASRLTCEIQVRTLFEEAWGEIDHVLNYPEQTDSIACREQLRVMAKMMGAGSRLAEAIFRSHREHLTFQSKR